MAKFCGNCGSQLPENARVCGHCGHPVHTNSSETVRTSLETKIEKINFKKWFIIGILVICIGLGTNFGLKFYKNHTGPTGEANQITKMALNYDIDGLLGKASYLYDTNGGNYALESYLKDFLNYQLDDFDKNLDGNYTISYEVEDVYDLPQRKVDSSLNVLRSYIKDLNTDDLSNVAVANVKMTAKKGHKSDSSTIKIYMNEEGKDWRLLYIERK